jgi:hypothetical protein
MIVAVLKQTFSVVQLRFRDAGANGTIVLGYAHLRDNHKTLLSE